jgi:calmodulin
MCTLYIYAQVDENLDGCVDWDEFLLMFNRNVNDQTGLEPSKLYNMVRL